MTEDIEVLTAWILAVALITAACTTAVPILYAFSPWRSRKLGRLFMLQALSFAAAIDLSVLFMIWTPPSILVVFWANALMLTAIAVSTSALATLMWKMNHPKKKGTPQ